MGIGPGPQPPTAPPGVVIETNVEINTQISTTQGSIFTTASGPASGDTDFLNSNDGFTWVNVQGLQLTDPFINSSITTGKDYFCILYQKDDDDKKIYFRRTKSKDAIETEWDGLPVELQSGFTNDYGALPVINFHDDETANGKLYATYKNANGELIYQTSNDKGTSWSAKTVLVNMSATEPKKLISLAATVNGANSSLPLFAAYTAVKTLPTANSLKGTKSNDKSAIINYGSGGFYLRDIYRFNRTDRDGEPVTDGNFCLGQVDITTSKLMNPSYNSIFVTTQYIYLEDLDTSTFDAGNNVQQIKQTEFTGEPVINKDYSTSLSLHALGQGEVSATYLNTFPVSIIYENNDYVVAGINGITTAIVSEVNSIVQTAFFITSQYVRLFIPNISSISKVGTLDMNKNYSRGTSLIVNDDDLFFIYISNREEDNTLSYKKTQDNFNTEISFFLTKSTEPYI